MLELGPLARDDVEALLAAGLGGPVAGATSSAIWELTRGNALFVRELARHGVDRGLLAEDGGVWRWRGPLEAGTRLAQLVDLRTGDVGAAAREQLESLAVAAPLELDAARRASRELERAELVVRRTDGPAAVRGPGASAPRRGGSRAAHRRHGSRRSGRGWPDAVAASGARRGGDLLRVATWRLDAGAAGDAALLTRAAGAALAVPDPALAERLARAAVQADAGVRRPARTGPRARRDRRRRGRRAAARRARAGGARRRCAGRDRGRPRAQPVLGARPRGRRRRGAAARRRGAARAGRPPRARGAAGAAHGGGRAPGGGAGRRRAAARRRGGRRARADHRRARRGRGAALVRARGRGGRAGRGMAAGRARAATTSCPTPRRCCSGCARSRCGWPAGWPRPRRSPRTRTSCCAAGARRPRPPSRRTCSASPGWRAAACATALRLCRESAALLRDGDAVGHAGVRARRRRPGRGAGGRRRRRRAPRSRSWTGRRSGTRASPPSSGWRAPGARRRPASSRARGRSPATRPPPPRARGQDAYAVCGAARALPARRPGGRRARPRGARRAGRRPVTPALAAAHAAALVAGDGAALLAAAERFAEHDALLVAAEAAEAAAARAPRRRPPGRARAPPRRAPGSGSRTARAPGRRRSPGAPEAAGLTAREREIALLAAGGSSSREIAARLVVSVRTVDNHLQNAYRKLGVTRRQDLPRALD